MNVTDIDELIARTEVWMGTTSLAMDNHPTINLVVDLKRALEELRPIVAISTGPPGPSSGELPEPADPPPTDHTGESSPTP